MNVWRARPRRGDTRDPHCASVSVARGTPSSTEPELGSQHARHVRRSPLSGWWIRSTFRRVNVPEPCTEPVVGPFDTRLRSRPSSSWQHSTNGPTLYTSTTWPHPQFAPEVAEMMEAGAALGETIELSPDALMAQAVAETGLDDFGDDRSFRSTRLRLSWGTSGRGRPVDLRQRDHVDPARPTAEEPTAACRTCSQRHPEIHDIEIARPIIIAGLPRTGTTHLHNLLAAIRRCARCRTGRASSRCSPTSSSRPPASRSPSRAHRRRPRLPRCRGAALQAHARDDRRPRARGDPAARDRLLVDVVRDDRRDAQSCATTTSRTTRRRTTST